MNATAYVYKNGRVEIREHGTGRVVISEHIDIPESKSQLWEELKTIAGRENRTLTGYYLK